MISEFKPGDSDAWCRFLPEPHADPTFLVRSGCGSCSLKQGLNCPKAYGSCSLIKNAAGLVHSKVNSTVIVSIKHNVILQSCCCLLTGPNPEPENPEAGAEAEGVGDEEGEEEEEADPDPTIDPDSKDRK